jgi:hypothetical protein
VQYEVISDQPCLIDAIGEMKPGEPVLIDEDGAKYFEALHGHKITRSNFPEYVKITVILSEE